MKSKTKKTRFSKLQAMIREKENIIRELNSKIETLNMDIEAIKRSFTWKLLVKYQKFIDIIMPGNSKIRKTYDKLIKLNQDFINSERKKTVIIKELINKKTKNFLEIFFKLFIKNKEEIRISQSNWGINPKGAAMPNSIKSKKILIACLELQSMTGMPMYFIYLIKGLKKLGYAVDITAEKIGGYPTDEIRKLGARVFSFKDKLDEDYSWMILSEPITECFYKRFPHTPAINLIHSKYVCEKPHAKRPQIRLYMACRQDVIDFWKPKIGGNWEVLNNPIDFERFKPVRKKSNKYTVFSASTLDPLRTPMFYDLIRRAEKENIQVIIAGKDYGALRKIKIPKNVKIIPECVEVERYIAQADEVAGIYMGRITLEAMAMGKKTLIYDVDGTHKKGIVPKNFKEDYDYKDVAKKIVDIMNRKWADVIIPHHNKHDLLAECLKCIPLKNFNIIVVAGADFSKAINKGAKMAETGALIFINDDIKFEPSILWKLLDDKRDIVGVPQRKPDGGILTYGLGFQNSDIPIGITGRREDVLLPSGAMLKVEKKIFNKLGGFDERYKNGLEDVDFCVRAKAKGYTMGIIDDFIIHHEAQSEGRFDFLSHNGRIFNKEYSKDYLVRLFKEFN